MKIRAYRESFIGALTPQYGREEAESFFYLVLEDFRGMKRSDLALQPDAILSEEEIPQWDFLLAQLHKEIPIQYILGNAHFFGLVFEVNDHVLIPRPETEELVQWILNVAPSGPIRILDIGTGSGCIAVTLAKHLPDAGVFAIDISSSALQMASRNAIQNGARVTFIEKDILATENLDASFDVIVSNPPYVRELEKAEIKPNVLANEPHLALFVPDDDALLFYRKIAELALKNLSANGSLFFEINQYLAKETMDMLEQMGFGYLELRQDIYGNDRMVLARRL